MTFLPIVERELRVASRRGGTYGTRMKIAGAATLAFAVCFFASLIAPAVPFGKCLFWGLSGLCMIYCLAAGRLMTADCLSREKREGTFGLLFLTDLKGYDVVLGKLAATSLDGFYGLLAVFPLLAIPLTTGGMTNGELWRMALVLLNTFVFSLGIGLFVSAVSRDEQKAMGANFGLLLLLAAALPATAGMIVALTPGPAGLAPELHKLFYSCPVYSFWQGADAQYKATPEDFWWSIGITFTLTLLLVLLACRKAPRSWQDEPAPPRSRKQKRERRRRWWSRVRADKAKAYRKQLLSVNAYFWLAARPYLKISYVWTSMGLMGVWWVFTTLVIGHIDDAANYTLAFLLNGMLKLWMITEAGHQLAEDKRSGAFELLLSTPLSARDMVRGQWLALRLQFLKPLAVAVVVELGMMILNPSREGVAQGRCIWLAGIFMLLADVVTVGWVAMSAALTAKNHGRATLRTAIWILLVPWLIFGAVQIATSLCVFLFSVDSWKPGWRYDLGWWFGLGMLVDVFFLRRAVRRLRTSFRQMVLEPLPTRTRFAWFGDGRTGSPERKTTLGLKLRRVAFVAVTLLAAGAGAILYLLRPAHVAPPKPVVVSISRSNNPVRVSIERSGFLFILPDGSLWSWGQKGVVAAPRQFGTNRDWVQVSAKFGNDVGLRSDGTVWEWKTDRTEPKQFGTDHDWVEARAGSGFSLGRKQDGTLWAWGKNSENQLGNGPGPDRPDGVQVGTNRNWKAITIDSSSAHVLALRGDGTLWIWGSTNFWGNALWFRTTNPFPTQVCRESDWVGLNEGLRSSALNQAGESWNLFPFARSPGPDVPFATIGNLVSTNTGVSAFSRLFATNWIEAMYETRPNGTLWATPNSWPPINPPLAAPLRIGQRSDWVSVWGSWKTMVGLTSDGTLWTWGLDFGQTSHMSAGEKLGMLREMVATGLGGASWNTSLNYDWEGFQAQKEPRPLFRMVATNAAPTGAR
jgi:ABC-type transport system involved in multi-copper enzyme maturation permease subunit